MHLLARNPTPEIGVDELENLLRHGSVRVLDVREDWEFGRGHVPGAVSVPLGRLASRAEELPRDKPWVVICQSGNRSLAATEFLLSRGFDGAVSARAGTNAWVRGNRPLERG